MTYPIAQYLPHTPTHLKSSYSQNVSFKALELNDIEEYKNRHTEKANENILWYLDLAANCNDAANDIMLELMIAKEDSHYDARNFFNKKGFGLFTNHKTKAACKKEITTTINQIDFLYNQAMSLIIQYPDFNTKYKTKKLKRSFSGIEIPAGSTLFDAAVKLKDRDAILLMQNSKYFNLAECSIPSQIEARKLGFEYFGEKYNFSKSNDLTIPKTLEKYHYTASKNDPKSLDDIGGMSEAKNEINEFIIKPWTPKYKKALEANSVKMPNGFLMYGPPGCGKTFIVKALASELNTNLFTLDMGTVGNCLAYETAKDLNKVFSSLQELYEKTGKPNILFMDELDSILASRSNLSTDWRKDDTNTILQLINNIAEKGIILIGATNCIEDIDKAALRTGRFDKKIKISKPDEAARRDIFKKLASKSPIVRNAMKCIDKCVEMTNGATCSDLDAMFQTAMRTVIFENRDKLTFDDLKKAYDKIRFNVEQ